MADTTNNLSSSSVELIKDQSRFDKVVQDAGNHLVVVHFAASWAEQCQQMGEVLNELSKDPKFSHVTFITVDAESLAEVSYKYEIVAAPTFIFLKAGNKIDRLDGANAAELTAKVTKHSLILVEDLTKSTAKQDLNERLKQLINSAPVMLFMKGSPALPKCGFSRQITQILNEQGIKYSAFDILEDDDVRQGKYATKFKQQGILQKNSANTRYQVLVETKGLKSFSNWPTYPQLYIKGELIGGLDVVKEMVESGELKDLAPKEEDLNTRLKKLINQSPVVLFMKGSPSTPRCGFSKTIVGILDEVGVPYTTLDILSDDEVRQGLKVYSNWPTYPQVYVKGELIGGLDVIKEMKESGELASVVLKSEQA
ncbi:glutaredoxin-3 [Biomphalaria pfeifferi]|uniref:Glutaredoxin-3 n=1 Tax=Biomphalaria pfeifferi TaxID=112525 RepID=A0AAD8BN81_BIOPF|nr:glutaredoxin-3 [Biomphalaria pfeifferi]